MIFNMELTHSDLINLNNEQLICPFDFSEGESELVSGFNTEFRGGGFALFFIAEYSSILFIGAFFSVLWVNQSVSQSENSLIFHLFALMLLLGLSNFIFSLFMGILWFFKLNNFVLPLILSNSN